MRMMKGENNSFQVVINYYLPISRWNVIKTSLVKIISRSL
jgi:hypothetical protein